MEHPTYEQALADRITHAKYFTWGDSKADYVCYKILSDLDEKNSTKYISKFGQMLAELRTNMNILDLDIIESMRRTDKFKIKVKKLLLEESKKAILNRFPEIKEHHTWLFNCISKASKLTI